MSSGEQKSNNPFQDTLLNLSCTVNSWLCFDFILLYAECARQDLDLHFLVDGSSSIGEENFDKIKTWIKTMVRSFDVGRYTTRVGIKS